MAGKKRTTRFIIVIFLMLIGMGSSIYLTDLFVRVHAPGAGAVDSFCAVSEGVNCVTVADSKYATVLGIPVSMYGVEFYAAALAMLLLTAIGAWRIKEWESYLFWLTAAAIPISLLLAFVAIVLIHSVCLLCCAVYVVNIGAFAILAVTHRRDLGGLVRSGPRELWAILKRGWSFRIAVVLVALVALSQFVWLPLLFGSGAKALSQEAWNGVPTSGQTIGSPQAPIKIEEFTDFECPWCSRSNSVVLELVMKYPQDVQLTHRDLPMDMACNPYMPRRYHDYACLAAKYGRCAAEQGEFWPYSETLFRNGKNLNKDTLEEFAEQHGLDLDQLHECLAEPATIEGIQRDIHEARRRKINGTPTYFVNGEMIVGYRPPEFWEGKVAEIQNAKE
ncbi:MAG: thioredoxin domain-containing protein [Candidatus Lernaella stagnicola]|nr:thioredoxin domain-containing protein [Candidatus Lernaella stagnicola]